MISGGGLRMVSASDIEQALSRQQATQAIVGALRSGLEPSEDTERQIVELTGGQLLLMPSASATGVGLKALTVAADAPTSGRPRIQGVYLLFDAETLEPRAILDGIALTSLRTPAVSIAAISPLLSRFDQPVNVLVFGAGPQGVGHAEALRAVSSIDLADVVFVVRQPRRAFERLPPHTRIVHTTDSSVTKLLERANVVVCATSARTPLFDSAYLPDGSIIVAVGSHETQARELDGPLMGAADVIVEDLRTASREAGDVVLAQREGHLHSDDLIPMVDIVRGQRALRTDRTAVFKSVGMPWQDLVMAEAVIKQLSDRSEPSFGHGVTLPQHRA